MLTLSFFFFLSNQRKTRLGRLFQIKIGREALGSASHLIFPHWKRGSMFSLFICHIDVQFSKAQLRSGEQEYISIVYRSNCLASFNCCFPQYCFPAEWNVVRIRSNNLKSKTIFLTFTVVCPIIL